MESDNWTVEPAVGRRNRWNSCFSFVVYLWFQTCTSTLKMISHFLWCAHVTYIIVKHYSPREWQDKSSCENVQKWKRLVQGVKAASVKQGNLWPSCARRYCGYLEKREYFLQFTRWEKSGKFQGKGRVFILVFLSWQDHVQLFSLYNRFHLEANGIFTCIS